MPKINREVLLPADILSESETKRLADILWRNGDPGTPACQQALHDAGFRCVSLAAMHNAQELNRDRLRQAFANVNNDPTSRLRVVVPGDHELDPALNANHPIKGAAAGQREQLVNEAGGAARAGGPVEMATGHNSSCGGARPALESEGRTESRSDGKPARKRAVRVALLGRPATHIFNWMGTQGWTVAEAMKVKEHFGVDVSFYTVRGQIWFGSKDKCTAAVLTPDEAAMLNRIAGKED